MATSKLIPSRPGDNPRAKSLADILAPAFPEIDTLSAATCLPVGAFVTLDASGHVTVFVNTRFLAALRRLEAAAAAMGFSVIGMPEAELEEMVA